MRDKEFQAASGGLVVDPHQQGLGLPVSGGMDIPGRVRVSVDVPPVHRWAYAAAYWPLALRNLTVRHQLHARVPPTFVAPFQPGADDPRRWCDALGLDADVAGHAPFMYAQATGTLLYMRVFASLGLNFRHLLHLDHASWLGRPAQGRQMVSSELVDLVALGAGKVVLTVASDVRNADGTTHLHVRDRFIVRGFSAAQTAHLPTDPALAQQARAQARRQPRLDPDTAQVLQVPVAPDAGRRFARVSGDANPVHTTPLGARLFGFPGPFLQGLATRNLVVGHLAAIGVPIRRIEMALCRPVFCGQTARLVREDDEFELLDAKGVLLASGRL